MFNRNRLGFSLVEVLVTIVILSIIALLIGSAVVRLVNGAKKDSEEIKKKQIEIATEKWLVNNIDSFDISETTTVAVGIDVVFVFDFSSSMRYKTDVNYSHSGSEYPPFNKSRFYDTIMAANDAINVLCGGKVDGVCANSSINLGYVFYDGKFIDSMDLTPISGIEPIEITSPTDMTTVSNGSPKVKIAEGHIVKMGSGTNLQSGLQGAARLLMAADNKSERIPIIISFADGESDEASPYNASDPFAKTNPTITGSDTAHVAAANTLQTAKRMREDVSAAYSNRIYVYSIGLGVNSDFGRFLLDPKNENLPGPAYTVENYTVKAGDGTYGDIALLKYSVPCEMVLKLNGIAGSGCNVSPPVGTVLKMPKIATQQVTKPARPEGASSTGYRIQDVIRTSGMSSKTTCRDVYALNDFFDFDPRVVTDKDQTHDGFAGDDWCRNYGRDQEFTINLPAKRIGTTGTVGTIGTDSGSKLYLALVDAVGNTDYDNTYAYVDKSYVGEMDAGELKNIFQLIAHEIVERTRAEAICLPISRLIKEGYVGKDHSEDLKEGIVWISEYGTTQHMFKSVLNPTAEEMEECLANPPGGY